MRSGGLQEILANVCGFAFPQVLSLAQQIVVMLDLPTSLAKKPDLQAAVLESVGKVCLRETNIHDRLKTDDGCR
jgi:hypothetical protein